MKLKELLNVIDKDQQLFISIYANHDIPSFFKGKPETLQTNRGIEPDETVLNSNVICVTTDAYGGTLYIDVVNLRKSEEEENEV